MDIGEQILWGIAYDSQWIELGIPLRKQGSYYIHVSYETGWNVVQLVECSHSLHKVLDSISGIMQTRHGDLSLWKAVTGGTEVPWPISRSRLRPKPGLLTLSKRCTKIKPSQTIQITKK